MKRETKRQIIVFLILFTFLFSSISYAMLYVFPSNNAPSIDGVECSTTEQLSYHIHAHLDVFVDGEFYDVPEDIGVNSNCIYWLHTHDNTGIIHIEAPTTTTFYLGQFLDIWGSSTVATDMNVPDGIPTVYVNGDEFSGDYKNIQLLAHDEIVLVYGTPPSSIPSSYNFPAGL